MKTAISIPDTLFHAAEEAAAAHRLSRSELYSSALQEYLETHFADDVTKRLDEVYADQPSSLDAVVAEMQFRSIPEDNW